MAGLNEAIQFIRAGQKEEARRILEPLLRTEPANIQAWFWYVETCAGLETRIQVLQACLKMNPGNVQVLQALQTLQNQRPPQPSFPPAGAAAQSSQSYDALYKDEPQNTPVYSNPPTYLEERPKPSVISTPGLGDKQKKPWEDLDSYVDNSTLSKPKAAARSYAFYEAWATVLTSFDVESYENILHDPEAGAGRGFEWVAYAGIISGLIAPLSLIGNPQFAELRAMPQFNDLPGNLSVTAFMIVLAFALALLTPILSVLSLALTAGLQNVIAGFFGGRGYYGRTVYAIAAFLAPMTILIALVGAIPLVGQCLGGLLGLYNTILNVRALRAAHSLSTAQAIGVIFTPTIILMILGCLIIFAVIPGLSR